MDSLLHYEGNTSGSELVSKTLDILRKLVEEEDHSVTEEDKDAALKCFMQLFVHEPLSEHMGILSYAVKLLKIQTSSKKSNMQHKICETLCSLIVGNDTGVREKFGKWKEIVTNVLVGEVVNIFGVIQDMLCIESDDEAFINDRLRLVINLLTTILNSNGFVKCTFDNQFEMEMLKFGLKTHQNLNTDVALALLELLTVNNNFETGLQQRVIHLESLTPILIQALPNFQPDAQRTLCESIRVMCATVLQNRLICCRIGLITDILMVLQSSLDLEMHSKDCLISIMEILGCLSITSSELKLLINLFHRKTQYELADRLVQSLERMASQSSQHHMQQQPKHFIDLYNPYKETTIKCPVIQKFNAKGITIHTWVCLDFSLPNRATQRTTKIRHILYSFLNARGEGFEAFFTSDGFLVIVVHTKKEFLTTTVTSAPFVDQEWHSLTIVHTKRLLGRALLHVYVDGLEIHAAQLQFPTLNKEIVHSTIGSSISANGNFHYMIHPPTTPQSPVNKGETIFPENIVAGHQNEIWGIPTSLKGQMSSFMLFNDSVQVDRIRELAGLGPNFVHLFTPKDLLPALLANDTAGLLSSVVFYYNAKAAARNGLEDLNKTFRDKMHALRNLTGHICQVYTIQESIQSLGGLPVLFPLLEQACFKSPKNKKFCISEDGLSEKSDDTKSKTSTDLLSVNDDSLSITSSTGLDVVDGSKPVLSDLPVLYSPKNKPSPYEGDDPERWTHEVDDELRVIEVVHKDSLDNAGAISTPSQTLKTPSSGNDGLLKRSQAGSFVVLATPPLPRNDSDWTLVDPSLPRTRSDTFKHWVKSDNHDINGVAHFVALIRNIIGSRLQTNITPLDVNGIKVISLLLHDCDPALINIGFHNAIGQLVESLLGLKDEMLEAVYQYIVFDFEIWANADISVQIAHIQLLSTYIKDDPTYFGNLFTIDYFLNIVQQFYCRGPTERTEKRRQILTETDERDLRTALLGLIFYLLQHTPSKENINYVLNFIAAVPKHEYLDEVLDMLDNATRTGGHELVTTISESGSNILYRWLVHEVSNKIRIKILSLIVYLLKKGKISDAGKKKLSLDGDGLFDGIGELLCKQDIDRDVIVHLLKLGISVDRTSDLKSDIYTDFGKVLTVFHIVQFHPRPVKLEVAIKVRNSLKLSDISSVRCANEPGWYEPIWRLIVSENTQPEDLEDVMEAELVHVVIEIIHIVMWTGIIGSDIAAWTKRIEAICSLHEIAARHHFILPMLNIERQLYEMCLEASVQSIEQSTQPYAVDTQNAVQILRLVEEFLISTEISDDETLKWSVKLIGNIFKLLNTLNAWDDSIEGGAEWVEVLQITERILYRSFMIKLDMDILVETNKRLTQLLHKRLVTDEMEATYQLFKLDSVLRISQAHELQLDKIINILLQRFERFTSIFIAQNLLTNLPSLNPATFKTNFLAYMETEEYYTFIRVIRDKALEFEQKPSAAKPSLDNGRLWMDSLSSMSKSVQQRQMKLEDSLENVSKIVYHEFDERRAAERKSLAESVKIYRQKMAIIKSLWQYQKRFLTSERGAWSSKKLSEPRHFRLSNTENCYRMRLKLTENLNYNPHSDAARQRDVSNAPDNEPQVRKQSNELNLADVTVERADEQVFSDEETLSPNEDEDEEEKQADSSHLYDLETFDQISGSCIHSSDCQLVTLMDVVAGRVELTKTHVCYYDDSQESNNSHDFKFALEELREVYNRRYNLRKSAIEFFLLDRSSYFINFKQPKDKDLFYRKLTGQRPKNLYYSGIQNPSRLLRVSKLTTKWVDREISNFEYLMQLNTISGRTYNDLAQYPVFPWVITDFESDTIDLENPDIYRDLTKPVGAINEKKAEEIKKRYDSFIDPSGLTQRSHYFTHYSNPGGILHYLVRVEPFTSLHIRLQGGKFDCADRQFYSIATTWKTVYTGGDVKELIPEFFCFPEFLSNLNHFNLGSRQRTGERVNDVALPPWAKNAYDFIDIHRRALESEYVSENLHSWIDLIFGYKQRGKNAEQALNVFSHYSYEGAVDLDKIEDDILREATEGMINNFGQTPTQLLKKPHPKRKALSEVDLGRMKVTTQLETDPNNINFSLIQILHMTSPVVFIAVCKPRPKSILYHAVPDSLITIHSNGLFGIHQWFPYTDTKSNNFSFTMDVLLASPSSYNQRFLPGVRSPMHEFSSKLFAFTSDGHLMLLCGYWDNSIRVVNTDRGKDKVKACVSFHNGKY
eukprot:TCONS_00065481-protein